MQRVHRSKKICIYNEFSITYTQDGEKTTTTTTFPYPGIHTTIFSVRIIHGGRMFTTKNKESLNIICSQGYEIKLRYYKNWH